VIWLGNFWYFGKLVAEERWLQPEKNMPKLSKKYDCPKDIQ